MIRIVLSKSLVPNQPVVAKLCIDHIFTVPIKIWNTIDLMSTGQVFWVWMPIFERMQTDVKDAVVVKDSRN